MEKTQKKTEKPIIWVFSTFFWKINWKKLGKNTKNPENPIIWVLSNVFLKKKRKSTTHLGLKKKNLPTLPLVHQLSIAASKPKNTWELFKKVLISPLEGNALLTGCQAYLPILEPSKVFTEISDSP